MRGVDDPEMETVLIQFLRKMFESGAPRVHFSKDEPCDRRPPPAMATSPHREHGGYGRSDASWVQVVEPALIRTKPNRRQTFTQRKRVRVIKNNKKNTGRKEREDLPAPGTPVNE
ncbi:hypothetical protein F2P81_024179 [Scophthalmus maximus]|uniref:Uncharacterized protein n=1 Tax=Scophthalmus maximus TaxID=52904 RepID=A0A6A4RTB2_SCOMX|nr:hypothetical protein F2P81_024179 [Scophthalmus maximus]